MLKKKEQASASKGSKSHKSISLRVPPNKATGQKTRKVVSDSSEESSEEGMGEEIPM